MVDWHEFPDEDLVRVGREAMRALRFERAREAFELYAERLKEQGRNVPAGVLANHALAVGHMTGVKDGIALCLAAVKRDRRQPEAYRCLTELYLMARLRRQAWEALRTGLSHDPAHPGLVALQRRMGVRRNPPVPFLHRDNPLNVRLGKALRRKRSPSRSSGAVA